MPGSVYYVAYKGQQVQSEPDMDDIQSVLKTHNLL